MKIKILKMLTAAMAASLIACAAAGCGETREEENTSSTVSQVSAETGSTESEEGSRTVVGAWINGTQEEYMRMSLYEDGTVLASASNLANRTFGSWTVSGDKVTITLYGGDDVYTYQNDQLVSDNDPSFVFVRDTTVSEQE